MKITKLELKNFKRFDDLTIDLTSLPEPAKLVLLIGTNGSGKSSVFDGLEVLNKMSRGEDIENKDYYQKNANKLGLEIYATINSENIYGEQIIASYNTNKPGTKLKENSFYGRTSIRQVSQLTRTFIGKNPVIIKKDSDRPRLFIERDNRFENDIESITLSILEDVFNDENSSTEAIKQRYINPINKALENIFGSDSNLTIRLVSFRPPSKGNVAEILFEKGASTIPYDLLSGGEKEVFNIMLNLLDRKRYFENTIYFLDEIDLHLNTQLQKNLLKEITENWIPDNCQLWTASHSLGFIDYANEADHAAIIDFDNLNFDVPQTIMPSAKNNFDIFEIAVDKDFLAKVFEGKSIIFSENTDTGLYNNLNIKNIIFFNAQNKADVFHKSKNNPDYFGLIDRDFLLDEEINELKTVYKNLLILRYYSIENYLFHPDNLLEYFEAGGKVFNKEHYLNSIKAEKQASRDKILINSVIARDSYPFYRENENNARLKTVRTNTPELLKMLDSEDFETFYKVFPAKDYGTTIRERQNLNRINLAKTNWFKTKIEEVLSK